jgi:hypothetical protein
MGMRGAAKVHPDATQPDGSETILSTSIISDTGSTEETHIAIRPRSSLRNLPPLTDTKLEADTFAFSVFNVKTLRDKRTSGGVLVHPIFITFKDRNLENEFRRYSTKENVGNRILTLKITAYCMFGKLGCFFISFFLMLVR